MNRQALRSTWGRAGPEIEQICQPHRTYFRQFSTTPSQWVDSGSSNPTNSTPPRPTQRSQFAPSRGSPGRFRGGSSGQQQQRGGGSRFSNPSGPGNGPVLDIRKTNFTFRGRGGGAGGQRGGMRGRGGFNGPGRRPPPGQSDRGGARRRGGDRKFGRRDDGDGARLPPPPRSKELTQAEQEEQLEAVAETAFQKSMTMGERTVFEPSVSLEDLQKYMPHFAGGAAGRRATVITNLAQLGTQDPVNAPQELQAADYARGLQRDGFQFFADLREREYTEKYMVEGQKHKARVLEAHKWLTSEDGEGSEAGADGEAAPAAPAESESPAAANIGILGDVEDSVKKVILEKAVMGLHEKPVPGTDAVAKARATHMHSGSYTTANANAFTARVQSLLARKAPVQRPSQQPETKAKEKKGAKKGQKAAAKA